MGRRPLVLQLRLRRVTGNASKLQTYLPRVILHARVLSLLWFENAPQERDNILYIYTRAARDHTYNVPCMVYSSIQCTVYTQKISIPGKGMKTTLRQLPV